MIGDKSVTATFVPPQPPRCTLRLKDRRAKPALTAIAVCNKTARLRMTGTVTEWLGRQTTRFALPPVTRTARRGRSVTLPIRLPTPALAGLKQGHRVAIRLTLRATGPSGTGRVSTRRIDLFG
jgi:hypothetical protein